MHSHWLGNLSLQYSKECLESVLTKPRYFSTEIKGNSFRPVIFYSIVGKIIGANSLWQCSCSSLPLATKGLYWVLSWSWNWHQIMKAPISLFLIHMLWRLHILADQFSLLILTAAQWRLQYQFSCSFQNTGNLFRWICFP